jgi:ribonuclease G
MASRSGQRSQSNGRGAVANEILINASAGETRVAIIEQQRFTELHLERARDKNVAGMVTKGKVTRVLPGMQAAFVDIGLEKAAFLYVGDYLDERGQLDPDTDDEDNPRPRRNRSGGRGSFRPPPRIETILQEGQEIVVQVAKEPIGTKGARITSHVSIAGRHLVLTPWSKRVGVSRRIESDKERRRLREVVTRLRPDKLGFIIRTAGEGAREADLEADVKYLAAVWEEIQRRDAAHPAPAVLYEELSLPLRVIRDFSNGKTKRIVIDDPATHEEMKSFLDRFVADPKPKLELYEGTLPSFDHFGIEQNIDDNLGRKAWLKSGGYLIIDQSEALTSIDVNTGRYVGKRDLEETVLKTNLEAVQEVVHQLRFRNIGGLIIIDLIDMETAENRDKVYRALGEALKQDKSKTNILKISELGLVEMTRKRTRENLVQQLCEPCSYCDGRGYLLSAESLAFKALREIRKDLPRFGGRQIAVSVNPRVAEMLLGPVRKATAALNEQLGREIEIRAKPGLHQEQFEVEALDDGPPVAIPLGWLGDEIPKGEKIGESEPEPEAPEAAATAETETPPAEAAEAEEVPEAAEAEEVPEAAEAEEVPAAAEAEEVPAAAAEAEAAVDSAPAETPAEPAADAPEPVRVEAAPVEVVDPPEEAKEPTPAFAAPDAPAAVDAEAESPILPRLRSHEES